MSEDLKLVDLTWSPDRIREFCESSDNWILELPSHWTTADVEELYRRHLGTDRIYLGVVVEIGGDARVSEEILLDIWKRFGSDIAVASAIATNPKTPESLLRELASHPDETIKGHAESSLGRHLLP